MTAFEDRLAGVDARLARFREEAKVPGVAWGVIRDGALAHVGGPGDPRRGTLGPTPTRSSASRR